MLVSSICLARYLEPNNYGAYSFMISVISILAIPAHGGTPTLIIRETAKFLERKEWSLIKGLWQWCTILCILLSIVSGVLLIGMFSLITSNQPLINNDMLLWSFLLVPILALGIIWASALRGLRSMAKGTVPELILTPLLVIIGIYTYALTTKKTIVAEDAMMIFMGCNLISAILSFFFLKNEQPKQLSSTLGRVYYWKEWFFAIIPLALISGIHIAYKNSGFIILGAMSTLVDVGVYKVAFQASILISFGLSIINILIGPYIAIYKEKEQLKSLQSLIRKSTIVTSIFAMLIFSILYFFGEEIIIFLYGQEYSEAYLPLIILALGQTINAFFGPAGLLLNMTGFEKSTLKASFIGLGVNVIFGIALVQAYGIIGVSFAVSLSMLVINIELWRKAKELVGINTILWIGK